MKKISTIAVSLSFLVVVLGAYTRLTNAGLSCPDWPGCYGYMVLPQSEQLHRELPLLQARYPHMPVELKKAWTEMGHRYAAFILALLILFIAAHALYKRSQQQNFPWKLPCFVMLLVLLQAILGMWTVTLQLFPLVVTAHLLMGMTIFACLSLLLLRQTNINWHIPNDPINWRVWLGLGLVIVFGQIALGGWVSANYAGIACVGFPRCNGYWLPPLDFRHSFNFLVPLGHNYQGGTLSSTARVTIQIMHRLGALLTTIYICSLGLLLWGQVKNITVRIWVSLTILLVLSQVLLGIINVVYWLPLSVATLHNAVAAILFADLVFLFASIHHDKHANN